MKTYPYARRAASRGLTLIELVVVLAILVALAGLIIGNFPGIVKRAGRSSSATTIQDVTRAVQYMYTTTLKYPNGYDSLLEDGGTVLYTLLPSAADLTPLAGGALAGHVTAFNQLGINITYDMDETIPNDATWGVVAGQPAVYTGAVGDDLVTISAAKVVSLFPTEDLADTYFIFGIGNRCTMVGPSQTMVEAPTHFGDSANENPKDRYGRYGVIYGYDAATTTARLVGAVAFTTTGVVATEGNIQQYWNN